MNKAPKTTYGVSDDLALSLLRLEMAAHPGANVVLSPLSVSMALGMMLNGSRGPARQQTAARLGFGVGRSLRGMNEYYSQLKEALAETREIDLDLASALYACGDLTFKKNFLNKSQQYFDAKIGLLDLDDPSSVVLMNSFICQKTKGKIPSMLDELSAEEQAQLILLNALYFRGIWHTGFNVLLSQEEKFTHLDGSRSDCALMYREGSFLYAANLKYQAVKLPYGESGRFAMYAFLPLADGEFGLKVLESTLADASLSNCFKHFLPRPGRLFLPRFRAVYEGNLNESLKQIGLSQAFADRTEFASAAKCKCGQHLSLKHKVVVEVNEEGGNFSTSQAPQGNSKIQGMILPNLPFLMRFDRPFYFFVRDEETETVVVAGFINKP